ncbi:MAG: DUF561 domain-containing protein [Cyanobacteria bacterium REEB65]|nr:DUF561 domain-containing protein [Cyanobacteria bacterium REEB65]
MLDRLHAAMQRQAFFKAISGLEVFDPDQVLPVARAAGLGADAIDVAADRALVAAVREAVPDLCIFASSLDPAALVASGADVLELGNYDAMYRAGQMGPAADTVLNWTREILARTQETVPLCVTIPLHLALADQIDLAHLLQAAGASILQVEGALGQGTMDPAARLQHALEVTTALKDVVSLPILVAGGLDDHGAAVAIASGANGVGIGHFIKRAGDEAQMTAAVRQVRIAIAGAAKHRTPIQR